MLTSLVQRIVAACCARAKLVLLIAVVVVIASASYSVTHFAINTDSSKLISLDLPWRKRETALNTAFPQNDNLILVVLDGITSERAEQAAQAIVGTLRSRHDHFEFVKLPDAEPFFAQNGLLFQSPDEVQGTADQLVRAQPLLSTLANDPTLRGFANATSLLAQGVERGRAEPEQVAPALGRFADTLEAALNNRAKYFSWRALITNKNPADEGPTVENGRRRLITIKPKLDYGKLEPGEAATDEIRQAVADLHLDPDTGVTVRLTGPIPLNDQEFGTVKDGFALNSTITVAAVLVLLWLALKSGRLIVAVFASTVVGLLVTSAVGFMLVGALNLISIAFAVLFIGIGVDFGIQFSVRYREERFIRTSLTDAIVSAGGQAGRALLLAAVATAAGFYSFLPTDYEGVSELGLIAGNGMIIAFLTSITVLPALLTLMHPPSEGHEVGYTFLAPVDEFLHRHRWLVIGGTLAVLAAGAPMLRDLRFDFNPLNLNSRKVESVATLLDLMKDHGTTSNTIQVLQPNLDAARSLGEAIAKVPEVDHVTTLASFVPPDQDPKLATLADAVDNFGPTLDPTNKKPAPSDADDGDALKGLASYATRAAAKAQGEQAATIKRFADAAQKLADAPAEARAAAREALVPSMKIMLGQVKDSLSARKVTLDSLPKGLVRDWVAPDGQARIEVTPKDLSDGNANLRRFSEAVRAVAPEATGEPILVQESGNTVIWAFIEAGAWALGSIAVLLVVVLRRLSDMLLTLVPLLLAGLLTLEATVLIGLPLNFANIIALPLLLGLGVAFKIYFVLAWRNGEKNMLTSSLTRAVFFSALCTAVAFGSLWASSHPGTSSMGELLALSLLCTLFMAVVFQTALMGPPRQQRASIVGPQHRQPTLNRAA